MKLDFAEVPYYHQGALLTHHSQDDGSQEFVNELQVTDGRKEGNGNKKNR